MIFHITTPQAWQEARAKGQYLPAAYAQDGFIHCSDFWQLKGTANRYYLDAPELLVLEIDHQQLADALVYENLEGGEMLFPHLYCPLPVSSVVSTFELQRREDGRWTIPPEREMAPIPRMNEIPYGLPGKAYRSVMPCNRYVDPDCQVYEDFRNANIQTVFVLQEANEPQERSGIDLFGHYKQMGLRVVHAPSRDFYVPPAGAWDEALAIAARELQAGHNIAIHCHAGIGRTGMFAACLAVDLLGLPAREAILWVRQYSPYAVETLMQERFVENYAASREKREA